MSIRRALRGSVSDEDLETVARETVRRQDKSFESVRRLDVDNWLSTPAVVNEEFFIKIVSTQNTVVQRLLTASRNLGALSSGTQPFFERFDGPLAMAEHELAASRAMQALDVNVPEPLLAFEHEGYGVVVLEYLPAFETLDALDSEAVTGLAPGLFEALARIHDAGLAHGDLRSENVLVEDGDLYFIDATKVDEANIEAARAYDIACALGALEPLIGAANAVESAREYCSDDELLAAERYLNFVALRPDHDFRVVDLKAAVEKCVDSAA